MCWEWLHLHAAALPDRREQACHCAAQPRKPPTRLYHLCSARGATEHAQPHDMEHPSMCAVAVAVGVVSRTLLTAAAVSPHNAEAPTRPGGVC